MKWLLLGGIGVLTVMLAVPAVRNAFDFGPTEPRDWVLAAGAAFLGVTWFEVYKVLTHHEGPAERSARTGAA